MLVARRAVGLVLAELDRLAAGCAELARAHRSTPMAARTLLQQAVPTTFGLKAAGWLTSTLEARRRLASVNDERLAAQLGGAAGTLAALGDKALEVVALFARELGLVEPSLPWHTDRQRLAELGAALTASAGAAAKVGRDIVLLAQTEVGEAGRGGRRGLLDHAAEAEPGALDRRGGLRATRTRTCRSPSRRARTRARTGGRRLARGVGGALGRARVRRRRRGCGRGRRRGHRGRRRSGCGGTSTRARASSSPSASRTRSRPVWAAPPRTSSSPKPHGRASFREALLADERTGLSAGELDLLLDPATYLGAAEELVDRALAEYDEAGR